MMTKEDTEPRIYVASLSDYNAGTLHGAWIDANQDADSIQAEVSTMLSESPTAATEGSVAEEWAIHDYEGFGSYKLSEWESFETVATIAAAMAEHGEGPVSAFIDNEGGIEYLDNFEESYCGEWASEEDYAQELAEDIGSIPKDLGWPNQYIDWERAAHDLFMGDFWSSDSGHGTVYVFRSY